MAATRSPRSARARAAREQAIHATIEAIRMLDLATARYRTTLSSRWGVTVTDSLVMSNLALNGGSMTPRDLARRMMVSSGTLTTMVDRLETNGFVERSANPADRRSLLVGLTDKGRESLFYTRSVVTEALDSLLPPDHGAAFADTLRAVAEALDAATSNLQASDA